MIFGPRPLAEAEGTILAHSLSAGGRRLRKGRPLTADDLTALAGEGIKTVTVAALGPDDMAEDAAATLLAKVLAPDPEAIGLRRASAFTGRANLHAEAAGILRVDADAIARFNAVDEAVTLATLPDFARVAARDMVATVKIIPYGLPETVVEAAAGALVPDAIRLHPFRKISARLILTRTSAIKPSVLAKGEAAIRDRLTGLGVDLAGVETVPHRADSIANAMTGAADLWLILGASATSDRADEAPAGLIAAGGSVARFGMPVDPGNLIFLGDLRGVPVIGLPGCVRSPALNGADWVLERLVAGLEVTGADIAAMGMGGLLKEIPTRPQPRGAPATARRPLVEGVLLAAGASTRMRGADKLLEEVAGEPLLRRAATALLSAGLDRVQVVLPPLDRAAARRAALDGLDVTITESPAHAEGMAASLRAGIAALRTDADAVLVALADMPEVSADYVRALLAAFDRSEGRELIRAVTQSGVPGHPVLFGRRFFETLAALTGDRGARDVIADGADYLVDVPTPGEGARVDLDTPEAWAAWRAGR